MEKEFPLSKMLVHVEVSRGPALESHFQVISSRWHSLGVIEHSGDRPLGAGFVSICPASIELDIRWRDVVIFEEQTSTNS